jgi:hypothetical protein
MLQKKLLESEGVNLIESRVQLNLHAWKPAAKTPAGKLTPSKARKTTTRRRRKDGLPRRKSRQNDARRKF